MGKTLQLGGFMDNEEDYVELFKLLAKCKFNIAKKQVICADESSSLYYDKKISEINQFLQDVPIIIKGEDLYG